MSKVKIKDGKINFCCKMSECDHSCCGPFGGITNEDYERFYNAGLLHFVERGYSEAMKKEYYKMALEEDGTCKAFINGMCSINKDKPTLCVAFPFYFDMFSGLCAIECEGFTDNAWSDLKNYEGCFEGAKKMYEYWIDFYSDKTTK